MGETESYAVIINGRKPKGEPGRYIIARTWVLLTSDALILGLFDNLEAALDFFAKLL